MEAIGPDAKTAIPALAQLLQDKDEAVRSAVTSALAEIGIGPEAKAAIPAFAELLWDKENPARSDAIGALVDIGPAAIPTFTQLLRNKDTEVRYEAANALGQIGPAAAPTLIELLTDKDASVRSAAVSALGQPGPKAKTGRPSSYQTTPGPERRGSQCFRLGPLADRSEGEDGCASPSRITRDKDTSVRQAAIAALGAFGPEAKSAIPALMELLWDKQAYVRRTASCRPGGIRFRGKISYSSPNKIASRQRLVGSP